MRRTGPVVVAALLVACGFQEPTRAPDSATQEPPASTPRTIPSGEPSVPPSGSPDAGESAEVTAGLAFVRQVGGVGQVFVVGTDGEPAQLTGLDAEASFGGATTLSWAPDGSRLAFGIGLPVGVSVGLVAADGGDPLIVDDAAFAAWSPDGTWLAVGTPFDAIAPGAENEMPVSLVDPVSGERKAVTVGIVPRWHPDGRLVVMRTAGASETSGGTPVLVAVDLESGAEEEILRGATDVAWSPDGERVAFVTDAPETCPPECHRIRVARADDLAEALVLGPGTAPRWSPDGELIAYATVDEGPSRVEVVELATGSRLDLGPGDASSVAWSATGNRLGYVFYLDDGTPAIRIVDRSGQILAELPGQAPAWRPSP